MKPNKIISFFLILAIAVLSFGPALAAPLVQTEALSCPAGTVSGTVDTVDADTGTVTVKLANGSLCTVNVNIDESHPIALLLGQGFGDLNPEALTASLQEAVKATTVCAADNGDSTGTWSAWDSEGNCPEGSVEYRVTSYDPKTGTYIAQPVAGGSQINFAINDPTASETVQGALETLAVEWALESDGNLQQVSDKIAYYHDVEHMGFGVLTKLYAIAEQELEKCPPPAEGEEASCTPATVEELVDLFQSGVGMGQIFKEYGRPDKTGVGHVRQDLSGKETGQDKVKDKDKNKGNNSDPTGDDQASTQPGVKKNGKPAKDTGLKGVCNAISKNGKPKKKVTCP